MPETQEQEESTQPSWLEKVKQLKVAIPLAVFMSLYIAFNMWIFFFGTKMFGKKVGPIASRMSLIQPHIPSPTATSTPVPTQPPTPSYLAPGRITYTISSSMPGPKIMSLVIDDHDPKAGSVQKLEVKVAYAKPIDSVTILVTSDHKERTVNLTKKAGAPDIWEGSWTLDDSILYKDIYTMTAKSGTESATITTAPRS